jgi:hypothetical protein
MIILNLLLRYYKNQFARIWIFSPSIKLDPQYAPLRKYLEGMCNQDKECLMYEDLDQKVLGKLLDEQRMITEQCRKRKIKAPQVCVVLDDLADRGDILTKRQGGTQGSWMISLATRGRHFGVTWIIARNKWAALYAEGGPEARYGGIAGTHWWINPRRNLAGIVMAQRQMAFWHPFSYEMKRAVYAACTPQTPYRET